MRTFFLKLILVLLVNIYTINIGIFAQENPGNSGNMAQQSGLIVNDDQEKIHEEISYDSKKNSYIITRKIGDTPIGAPRYMSFEEYSNYELKNSKTKYWNQKNGQTSVSQDKSIIPSIYVDSEVFSNIFGSKSIQFTTEGLLEGGLSGNISKTDNSQLTENQQSQFGIDFNQLMQFNLTGHIGNKLKVQTNFNSQSQFDFENQIKFDYTGTEDEIIQKIELGNVSMPIGGTLIKGSQNLFGIKTKLKFGKLDVTAAFSQQKSQTSEINIINGGKENEFNIRAINYDANRHYFLANFFRERYEHAIQYRPNINSPVTITKIEVWVTNKKNYNSGSRNIIALLDLAENKPYNTKITPGKAQNPSAFKDVFLTPQSNNLLDLLAAHPEIRDPYDQTNAIFKFFENSFTADSKPITPSDNYAKITYALKLNDKDFYLDPKLGYISLSQPLNNDEVLAVAYRYIMNGQEYQVGEFATDLPLEDDTPGILFVKLLKNELTSTYLPTWNLMMKNIYSLNSFQIERKDFRLNIFKLDEQSGVDQNIMPEGLLTKGKLYIQLLGLDNLNAQDGASPDGEFDFIEGVTINTSRGLIIFPVLEPFGSDLAKQFDPGESGLINKYTFKELYLETKADAQNKYPNKDLYSIKGFYQSSVGAEFYLNVVNISPGSVRVTMGSMVLKEGSDYSVDYNLGRVLILNAALLNSNVPIKIEVEGSEEFGLQSKSFFGSRLDYNLSDNLKLGATFLNLSEKPLIQKLGVGQEAVSNSIWGLDFNYSLPALWLDNVIQKLPFINAHGGSQISLIGEFAQLLPGHPRALNYAGDKGVAYLDDFESVKSDIDLRSFSTWSISSTPRMFPESALQSNLEYGYNRAKIAFYSIDPIFYSSYNIDLANQVQELSNHYVRSVSVHEVYPNKDLSVESINLLTTFDIAYYPKDRGMYNFTTTAINPDDTLQNPERRWGGIMRRIDQNDFDALNVEYIDLWVLDPFIYDPNAKGGKMYVDLGTISEDILKDGLKSVENALPTDGDEKNIIKTVWGKIGKLQPVSNSFDNNPESRARQDVGLNGLSSPEERVYYADFLQAIKAKLNPEAYEKILRDPAGDDFDYFRYQGRSDNRTILQRYKNFNGMEGNSKTTEQSMQAFGLPNGTSTPIPDSEDINKDNSMNTVDSYYEYEIDITPEALRRETGKYVNDVREVSTKLPNGKTEIVRWIQLRVPILDYKSKVGDPKDFRTIKTIRLFLTDFNQDIVMRFARLALNRSQWRVYNPANLPKDQIKDPEVPTSVIDVSTISQSVLNIEENSGRQPIPYQLPPGIVRQEVETSYGVRVKENEQSVTLNVEKLSPGFTRGIYKIFNYDVRKYKKLKMFIHAEALGEIASVANNEVSAVIRLANDFNDNYYEYEVPLKITPWYSNSQLEIWPEVNNMEIDLKALTKLKMDRNNSGAQTTEVYARKQGNGVIAIKGQPDLSRVKVIMLGVKNPYANNKGTKTVSVWFDELRLVGFDEEGGWAANLSLNLQLADIGNVTVLGSRSSFGFGSLDRKITDLNMTDNTSYGLATTMELGKLLPDYLKVSIPAHVSFYKNIQVPKYSPISPDLLLSEVMENTNFEQRDSLASIVNTVSEQTSVSLTNIRKLGGAGGKKIYSLENFSLSMFYNHALNRSYIIENNLVKTFGGALAYNYQSEDKLEIKPFDKLFSETSKMAYFKNFSIKPLPSNLSFRVLMNRHYSENTLRATEGTSIMPGYTSYSKNFVINKSLNLSWNLLKPLNISFTANDIAVIDEPNGPVNSSDREEIIRNLLKLGRITDYTHDISVAYLVPVNQIPILSWINLPLIYRAGYKWKTEPLVTLNNDPQNRFGNMIANTRVIQISPQLNLSALYTKLGVRRNLSYSLNNMFKYLLTAFTNISANYNLNEGIYLPGYMPRAKFLGGDFSIGAPGFGFLIGDQTDIKQYVLEKGWLVPNKDFSSNYTKQYGNEFNYKISLEPLPLLKMDLYGNRTRVRNEVTSFKYDPDIEKFDTFTPSETGSFSVSWVSVKSAFFSRSKSSNVSEAFSKFKNARKEVAFQLASKNPNSTGLDKDGYPKGYGQVSQDVLLYSFFKTYLNKDAGSDLFSKIPLPNWTIRYTGLNRIFGLSQILQSININHSYRSTYNINNFNSLINYSEDELGNSNAFDINQNFLPKYRLTNIVMADGFTPLMGVNMQFKNNMLFNAEYRNSRTVNFSFSNNQIVEQHDNQIIFGVGYKTDLQWVPIELLQRLRNNTTFKMDFSIRDSNLTIFQLETDVSQIQNGSNVFSLRPSVDLLVDNKYNLELFFEHNVVQPATTGVYKTSYSQFGFRARVGL